MCMSNKMSSIIYSILAVALVAFSIWFVRYIIHQYKPSLASLGEEYVDMPQIQTEDQLENALKNAPRKYILNNVPVFGTPVEDSLGLMKDKHLANIRIVFEYLSPYGNGARSYNWYPAKRNTDSKPDNVMLFNKYQLCWKDADFQAFLRTVNSDDIAPGASVFNCEYYDNSTSPKRKYILHKLDNGDKVSFVATVGNGEIKLENFGPRKTIAVGDPSQMVLSESTLSKAKFILFIILGVCIPGFLLILLISKWISSGEVGY